MRVYDWLKYPFVSVLKIVSFRLWPCRDFRWFEHTNRNKTENKNQMPKFTNWMLLCKFNRLWFICLEKYWYLYIYIQIVVLWIFCLKRFCIVWNKVTCKTCVFVVVTVCKTHREIERGRKMKKKTDFNKHNIFVLNHFVLMSDIKAFTFLVLNESLFSLRGASKWKWFNFDCFFFPSFLSISFWINAQIEIIKKLKVRYERQVETASMRVVPRERILFISVSYIFFLVCFVFSCCAWCE